jgi:hypothetical protein
MSQVNYKNLGCQIVAARGMAGLTRVELAKLAKLGHPVVKQAEDGDPKVSEDALVKICRALEGLGFEFSEGTAGIALAYHRSDRNDYGVTVDPSMPGLVRRIYPRQLGIRDLFKDLDTCGIVIENADRAMGLFLNQSEKSLPEYLVILVEEGRRFGIRFRWRTGVRNIEGVRYALATYYGFNENAVERVLHNIMDDNARAAVGARGADGGATGGLSFKTASNPAPPGAAAESSRSVFRGISQGPDSCRRSPEPGNSTNSSLRSVCRFFQAQLAPDCVYVFNRTLQIMSSIDLVLDAYLVRQIYDCAAIFR